MKIAVCDDHEIQLDLINEYIEEWSESNNINVSIDNFKSS